MEAQLVNINKLKNNTGQIEGLPKNPRLLKDDKFKKLVKSIQDDPEMLELREVIAYDNNGELIVIAGNMRLKACQEVGIKEIPTKILPQNTSVEKLKAYTIKDNVAFGEHNWDDLANNWNVEELTEWGLDIPNFDVNNLEAEEDDFAVPDGGIETDIVLGDLFEIGEHRLLCGDSTDSDQVALLMNGQKADMVFTDPPYGVSASGGRSQTVQRDNIKKIANDELRGGELQQFIRDALSIMPIKELGSFYVCYDQKTQVEFISAIKDNNWNFKRTLIWNKNVFGLSGKKGYRPKYELIAFGCIGDDYKWFGDNSQADVIDVSRPKEREGNHPTPKPIKLIEIALNNSSEIGNIIIDSFLGSGSTMVAAHQLKRKCYGMELDPKYCQVIVDRMLKLDPTLIIKKNGLPL